MLEERDSRVRDMNRGMVAIYKQSLGKGPIGAKTEINDSFVATILRGSLTQAEQTLVDGGQGELVREMRRTFQDAMRGRIEGLASDVLGRESHSFLSDHDVANDVAIEVVVFDPA